VIELAGGLLSTADTDSINRAEYVEDGEKITIPVVYIPPEQGETEEPLTENPTIPEEGTTEGEGTSSVNSGLVNINSASKEELKSLNGIGDAKADKIIEYRKSGRFRSKEDIKKVEGIGEATYNSIKDLITV
jgi:competence protein ComEA